VLLHSPGRSTVCPRPSSLYFCADGGGGSFVTNAPRHLLKHFFCPPVPPRTLTYVCESRAPSCCPTEAVDTPGSGSMATTMAGYYVGWAVHALTVVVCMIYISPWNCTIHHAFFSIRADSIHSSCTCVIFGLNLSPWKQPRTQRQRPNTRA